jgi:hypothetical protein
VAWFEDAWSDGAIAARAEAARARFPERPVPEGFEAIPYAEGSRLVYDIASQTFARLIACIRGLVDADIPTGVGRTQRCQHAERIIYVHRLCCDPDFDYRGESYMGTNSREWVLGCVYQRDRQEQSCRVRAEWYRLVAWALRELEDIPARAEARTPSPLSGEQPGDATQAELRAVLVNFLSTADVYVAPAGGGREAEGTEGALMLRLSLAELQDAAERVVRARVGDGDLFATPVVGDHAWSAGRWVLLATGRGGERKIRGITTWDPGPGSIGPGDLIPSRLLDGMRRRLALLPGPVSVEEPAAVVDVKALAAELRDVFDAGSARKGETCVPHLPVRGKLQEAVLDVLAAEDGSVPLSAAEIAGKNACKGKDPKSINRAVDTLRKRSWADVLETTDAGHRLLPSKRHLLPKRWRSELTDM